MKKKKIVIEISHRTIVFIALFTLFCWLLYQIREVLFLFFISLILMGAMNPTVKKMEKKRIPRWLAIVLVYLFLIFLVGASFGGILPPLIEQIKELGGLFPHFVRTLSFLEIPQEIVVSQLNNFGSLPTHLLRFGFSLFSNLLTVLVVLVITFYLLLEHQNLDRYLFYLFGKEGQKRGRRVIERLETRLGGWVRGEAILMFFVAFLSFVGFQLLGLEFALALALLAGILEIVPNIGPIIATFPAAFFGFLVSPLTGIAVLAWCFLVQQIENNFLVPKVMKGAVGVNPVVTLFSLAVGFKIAGVVGALLAIPVYILIEVLVTEFFSLSR